MEGEGRACGVCRATGPVPATSESWGIKATRRTRTRRASTGLVSVARRAEANGDGLYVHSVRADVRRRQRPADHRFKLLMPEDWQAFLASRPEFQREWDRITGLR
jgi:hypothetical protein